MQLELHIVDAFTSRLFHGNPAAVCLLHKWLPDALMQNIAAENNLAETAFLVPEGQHWQLRWFTPEVEVDLCGHATLASAFVLARQDSKRRAFRFHTKSGELLVTGSGELFTLDFPARPLQTLPLQKDVDAALGVPVLALTRSARTYIAEVSNEAQVKSCQPDFTAIRKLDCFALIITARGTDCDIVSRFFAPNAGINEDPVTGSAHCGLVPYWAAKLNKNTLHARQLSKRGGELFCQLRGDRVMMGGHAVLYGQSKIYVPDP